MSKWFYLATTNSFGGFVEVMQGQREPEYGDTMYSIWGPFNTYAEAKKDAIGYFQTDIREARRAVAEIKAGLQIVRKRNEA